MTTDVPLQGPLEDPADPGMPEAPGDAPVATERRGRSRFALMMRSAKLIGRRGEYLCIVRDVSDTGVKLRMFHRLPDEEHFALELSDGVRAPVNLAWESEQEAGFRFVEGVNATDFIAAAGPFPKRPMRIKVEHDIELQIGESVRQARLCDISRQGARIETEERLAIGQKLIIRSQTLPTFEATVCWRREPAHGLVFAQLMGLEELALRAFAMQPVVSVETGRMLF